MKPARAFTMMEVVVASALSLVIVACTASVLTRIVVQHRRDAELARLRGQADLVLWKLGSELRQAGLGVPRGARLGGTEPFPRVLAGDASSLSFSVDLPRTDSPVNGFSLLASDQGWAASNDIALVNELNGDCDVDTAGTPHCDTDTSSLLLPPSGTGCGVSAAAPTCPWGLNKYRAGERLILSTGNGDWQEVQVSGALSQTPAGSSRRLLALDSIPAGMLSGSTSRAFLSSPDRVYWRTDSATIQRAQCWGSVGTAGAVPTAVCSAGADGTGWETMATDLDADGFALDYQDAAGNALGVPLAAGDAALARRFHVVLQFISGAGETTTRVRAESTFSLRQWQ